ncbi:hypothetical protein R1sor_004773 [Riccia sorocarpa]|uniref:NB-ARC domain-containing protein n=1 Tax=Riccia sorocarpa TaxID=122646 RepID=A0ABD3HL55_9MARC
MPGNVQLSDSVFEVFRPSEGYIDLEIVFFHGFRHDFHGFGSKNDTDSYYRTWMKTDGSGNWLDTLFAESFPRARTLSVSYESPITSLCTGREDMWLLGESLVQSLVDLAGVGRSCPVVLVGHCLGGMVLKTIALCAESYSNQQRDGRSFSPYETFLKNMKGAFFLSTPSLCANILIENVVNQGGSLLKILEQLGNESARINAEFAKLRRRWKWTTRGVFAANETETTKFLQYLYDIGGSFFELEAAPQYVSIVPEASARTDMDEFGVISGVDHFTICQSQDSFAHLINLLTKIKEKEEQNAVQSQQSFGLHSHILDLDHRLESVLSELQLEKAEPLGLALVGMDGIGKSTLAKQVVNATRNQFEYVCLVELENVDRSRRSRMLETLVAQNLQYWNGRRVRIDEGQQPWVHIRGKKVLMVIDDAHSEDEISQLSRMDWYGEGSRLIITSSRQNLRCQLIVHQVPFLSEEASHELLATYLDESTLKTMPKKVISQLVDGCDGLPLVLEVIGKYLWDKKEVRIWSGALQMLRVADSLDGSVEENVVWMKLKVSFDNLGKLEKQILLDVATFDLYPTCKTQYDLEIFRSAWNEELVDLALINLEQRSFLSLVEGKSSGSIVHAHRPGATVQTVWIHKQIQAMATWISGPAEKYLEDQRNIWQLQNLTDLLTNYDKVSKARTEVLSISMRSKIHVGAGPLETLMSLQWSSVIRPLRWSSLGSLKVLRLLRISDVHMLRADKLKFPAKLALLHLENCTREPQKDNWWLPQSRLSSWPLCDENIEELGALSVLIFENCSFVQLPQNFYRLRCLKILRIHSGKSIGELPENISMLPALKHLSLNVPLKRLPNSLLDVGSLQTLTLKGERLQAWPDPITVDPDCHLTALTELHLNNLPALVGLPDTFGGLASLKHLTIDSCAALKELPEGFGALSELRTLSISHCEKLELLCESFSSLSQLRRLSLLNLPKLRMLPTTIGGLLSLEEMRVFSCSAMKELPESFTSLPSLRALSIHRCHALETLSPENKYYHVNQGKENLKSLDVYRCPNLQGLPTTLGQLKSLEDFAVSECREVRFVGSQVGKLKELPTARPQRSERQRTGPEVEQPGLNVYGGILEEESILTTIRKKRFPNSGTFVPNSYIYMHKDQRGARQEEVPYDSNMNCVNRRLLNSEQTKKTKEDLRDERVARLRPEEYESGRDFSSKQSWTGSSSSKHPQTLRSDAVALGFTGFEDPFDPGRLLVIHIESSEADLDAFEEIVFLHDEGMALLFGVGLPFSKVVLRSNGEIAVYEVGQTKWRWILTDSRIGSVIVLDARVTTGSVFQGTDNVHAGEIRGCMSDSKQAFKCHPLQRSSWLDAISSSLFVRGSGGTTPDPLLTEMNNSRGFSKAGGSSEVVATEVRIEQQPEREVTVEIHLDPDTCDFEDSIIPDQLLDQLSDHRIEPVLVLTFFKEPKGDQILRRFRSAVDFRFYMSGKLNSDHEKFGWYHDDLELSFKCLSRNVVTVDSEGVKGSCRRMTGGHDTPVQNVEVGNATGAGGNEQNKAGPATGSRKLVSTNNTGDAVDDTATDFHVKLQGRPGGIGCLASIADNYNIWDMRERRAAFLFSGMMSDALFKLNGNWSIWSKGFTEYELIGTRDFILKMKRTNPPKGVGLSSFDTSTARQDSELRVSQKIRKVFQVDHSFTSFEDLSSWQILRIALHDVASHPISGKVDVVPVSCPGQTVRGCSCTFPNST